MTKTRKEMINNRINAIISNGINRSKSYAAFRFTGGRAKRKIP